MAGLVPAIHAFAHPAPVKDVDARHKACARAGRRPDPSAGHDEEKLTSLNIQIDIDRDMVGWLVPAAHMAIDAGADQPVSSLR